MERRRKRRKPSNGRGQNVVVTNEPSAEFFAALQAQRESQANSNIAVIHTPKHIPGFYFDEKRGKYFRVHTSNKGRHIRKSPLQEASTKARILTNFFRSRESNWMWSATRRDRNEIVKLQISKMKPVKFYCAYELLYPQHRRITDCTFNDAFVAIASSSGTIEFVSACERRDSQELRLTSSIQIGQSDITGVQWNDHTRSKLVYSGLGHPGRPDGGVGILNYQLSGAPIIEKSWVFRDPWCVQWNPIHFNKFSIGGSGPCSAVYVDCESETVTNCNIGIVKSDVLSQRFWRDGDCILNGTRNGTIWLWDLRSSRGHYVKNTPRANQAAVQHMYVARDNFRLLSQNSRFELSLLDLRTNREITKYISGETNSYSSMLKFSVDATEAVIVAPNSSGIPSLHEMPSGKMICDSILSSDSNTPDGPNRIEQVHLKFGDLQNMWGIGRHRLHTLQT